MIHFPESLYAEQPAIRLFQKMGYEYLEGESDDDRNDIAEVILKDRVLAAIQRLNPWINEKNLQKVFYELTNVQGVSLMEINQNVWQKLRKGTRVKQVIAGQENFHSVHFIGYDDNQDKNDFLIVNQMKFKGNSQNSIPDLVVFINGLPIGVIECKSPSTQNAWDKAYNDLSFYQGNSEKLFHYNQICAGIWGVGGRYGAIQAPQQFYSLYRTPKGDTLGGLNKNPSQQDIMLYALFKKDRILEIIRYFVLFELDEGTTLKKLPRYQQLRATDKTISKLKSGKGGVIWHTQGSGKSITMAYVTRKLQSDALGFNNPTVLILTDRKELDGQISRTFQRLGFANVQQASSVLHLDSLLDNTYGGIITTTLQKFQETVSDTNKTPDQTEIEERKNIKIEKQIDGNILTKITKQRKDGKWIETGREEVRLEELSAKKNLYVLVDEAHRSQYGFLAAFMRTVLPHAKFVAFTGTPISKDEKSTLGEFYGGDYIDTYTIKESVTDGATVELLYNEGIAVLEVKKEALNKEFDEKFGHYPAEKRDRLKRKALKDYQLSSERMRDIAAHLIQHYSTKIYPDGHKAMLVCSGREMAIKYQQIITQLKEEGVHDFATKVVISIGTPKTDKIAKEYYSTIEWNKKHPNNKKPIWVVNPNKIKTTTNNFKLPFGDERETEKSGKIKYDNTAILIVSDMLLTGYDIPIASCLYLDKSLKEHNLLQAITRVNRSGKGKKAGYIMDYSGISESLVEALKIFSDDMRREDILKDINEEIPRLEINHSKLVDYFRPVRIDRHYERVTYLEKALKFIEPIDKRDNFKILLKQFNKSINLVLPNPTAMDYLNDFKLFNELKLWARNTFEDDLGLKISEEDSQMLQGIIDEHLTSKGVTNLFNEPVPITDKEKFEEEIKGASEETQELKMRNKLKYTIKVGQTNNPNFFKLLADRLDELLKEKEANRYTNAQLLLAYAEIQDTIILKEQESVEKGFDTDRKRVVYDSMKVLFEEAVAEDVSKVLLNSIKEELNIIDWEQKGRVKKDIENKIMRYLKMSNIPRNTAKEKAKELVNLLKKNKDA